MVSTLLLRIEPELKERLRTASSKERRSMASLILTLVDKYLQQKDKENDTVI